MTAAPFVPVREAQRISVSAKAAVVRDGKVLLVGYDDPEPHYNLPGGRLLNGESLRDAVVRKLWQECRARVEVGRQILVFEHLPDPDRPWDPDYQRVQFTFEARLLPGSEPVLPGGGEEDSLVWLDLADLAHVPLVPAMGPQLLAALRRGERHDQLVSDAPPHDGTASDPGAVRCRRLRPRLRTPNAMRDVAGFLRRWQDPAAVRAPATLLTSPEGNINTVGRPGVHEADDLDPAHPQWRDALEPGVRDLVEVCVQDWGCVTYDSCQGHRYSAMDLTPAPRRVGILPRDAAERSAVAAALCRVVADVAGSCPPAVQVIVASDRLECLTAGDARPVLDLSLEPAPGHTWDACFAGLDEATALVLAAMRRHAPRAGRRACGCPPTPAPPQLTVPPSV